MVKFVGNVPGQAARRRHPAAQGLARHEGGSARDLPASRTPRSSRRRKSKSSKKTVATQIRHRNRSRHHQLRAGLRGDRGRTPTRSRRPTCELLPIPQLENPGEVRDEDLLPSFLYLPGAGGFSGRHASRCPGTPAATSWWAAWRRSAASRTPAAWSLRPRSWLSHSGVDRTAPLLPFRAPEGVAKISPVDASRRYLEHLREAWDAKMPDAPFAGAAGAGDRAGVLRRGGARADAGSRAAGRLREHHAARRAAGRLLCLDRAALRTGASASSVGDLILVVDIGGGTTDFTLIAVTEANGELSLNRVAVGEHILLGGDNIDLALAGVVAQRLAEKGTRIDSRQHQALWANCRVAKEKLLDPASKAKETAGHDSGQGHRPGGRHDQGDAAGASDIEQVLGEGFLPAVASTEMPAQQRRVGLAGTGPALRRRPGHHAPPGALPAAAGGHARSTARCGAARAAWPAPRTCCSTAAC